VSQAAAGAERALSQRSLSTFLHAELLHTLGAYQMAGDRLGGMNEDLEHHPRDDPWRRIVEQAGLHNWRLQEYLHHPSPPTSSGRLHRHPSPLSSVTEKPDPDLLVPVQRFYRAAAGALRLHLDAEGRLWSEKNAGEKLGQHLSHIHDPHRREAEKPSPELVEGRHKRTLHRLREIERLQEIEPPPTTLAGDEPIQEADLDAILDDHLGSDLAADSAPLHLTILKALSDAHMWMHEAEHRRSQAFKWMFTSIPETHDTTEAMLKRSIALNTFVYVAARSMPWVFAENDDERAYVVEHYDKCCESLTPTYCMWTGNQIGLLALQRRAYSWWTLGRRDRAYCDFYKLSRLLRDLRWQIDRRAMRVPGTRTLVGGLTATAEHHIGRIYRGQHAHRIALGYFDRASSRLKGWESHPEVGPVLQNSRWHVNLLLSQGKANYELGKMKESLLSYARAWEAFLILAQTESHLTANVKVVKGVVKWLKAVKDEPEIRKAELSVRLEPLVKQFETVYSPLHLRLLAADIIMRLGHLLYILKLPPVDWRPPPSPDEQPPAPDHELARRCMFQAAELDPANTLIATDLLKIRHGSSTSAAGEEGPTMDPFGNQWPAGGGRFDQAVRVIEYLVQNWLDTAKKSRGADKPSRWPDVVEIAQELLSSFLAHTDSSNVKLAQVYQYLMQKPRMVEGDDPGAPPMIEIVCLRRYSSFFPFLPRPAAFRALGGGYLVQVRKARSKKSFGIAVDPGPDFLDNLYRAGYSLADIHMIVLTHDHADHIASLDALLALMGIRLLLGDRTFSKGRRLTIVGNKSVVQRYRFFNLRDPVRKTERKPPAKGRERAERKDMVRVMSFNKISEITSHSDPDVRQRTFKEEGILPLPDTLRIEPVRTVDHLDASGYPSQGFMLSIGEDERRSSALFTGDTGAPLPKGNSPKRADGGPYLASGRSLAAAVTEADVVVAHLSSVPLPELREMAGLEANAGQIDAQTEAFKLLWAQVAEQASSRNGGDPDGHDEADFLLRQLQFAFRSHGKERNSLDVSPVSDLAEMRDQPERHLYLSGLIEVAKLMAKPPKPPDRVPLLLIGELREELGTFRTRIASRIEDTVFDRGNTGNALTADIGLRVRIARRGEKNVHPVSVLCTTCDLDNDLIAAERFHAQDEIQEVCVKGENEGVFYNCKLHDPGRHPDLLWVEAVERYNVFGE